MFSRGSKGRDAWEDDNFEDEEYDEDEEYGEYDEEEDVAVVEKRAEAKKAAQAKAASASKKTPATKPKAEPAPKQTASSAASAKPLTSEDKQKIELSNRKMNYELSAELFGGVDIASPSRPDFKLPGNQNFETFTPQSEEDFELFATYVGGHLAISGHQFHYRTFIKAMLKHALSNLQPSDIEEIALGVSIIQAEREKSIEAAKAAAASVRTRADDYAGDFM